jgi:DNA-binding NtrC family response regulator
MSANGPTLRDLLVPIIDECIDSSMPLAIAMGAFSDLYVERGLHKTRGSRTRTGRLLGVHRNTIGNRIKRRRG